jgi:hypothetical protein
MLSSGEEEEHLSFEAFIQIPSRGVLSLPHDMDSCTKSPEYPHGVQIPAEEAAAIADHDVAGTSHSQSLYLMSSSPLPLCRG